MKTQGALVLALFLAFLMLLFLHAGLMYRVAILEADQAAIAKDQGKLAEAVTNLANASIKNSEAITHLVRVLGGR